MCTLNSFYPVSNSKRCHYPLNEHILTLITVNLAPYALTLHKAPINAKQLQTPINQLWFPSNEPLHKNSSSKRSNSANSTFSSFLRVLPTFPSTPTWQKEASKLRARDYTFFDCQSKCCCLSSFCTDKQHQNKHVSTAFSRMKCLKCLKFLKCLAGEKLPQNCLTSFSHWCNGEYTGFEDLWV